MFYLTPAQLRAMDLGVDLSGLTDAQLASHIAAASLAVNTHTLAPNLPVPHDFRGGSIIGETHTWRVDPYRPQPMRRLWLYHRPVIEVLVMRIYATNTQYVEFNSTEIYYEASEGWVEPASANMTSYGLFGAAMLPFVGLSEPHASVDYTYGSLYPIEEQLFLTETANVWRGQIGFWSNATPEVRVNGAVRNAANYAVNQTEGTITMTNGSEPTGADTVEVSAVGTLHPNIMRATALTTIDRIASRPLASTLPSGIRAVRIAELSLERSYKSEGAGSTQSPSVPADAAALLEEFIFYPLAFG